MRYLGAYPSEEELLNDILPPLCGDDEESAAGGGVRLDRFEALMVRVINDRLYEPDSEEMILQAFKVRIRDTRAPCCISAAAAAAAPVPIHDRPCNSGWLTLALDPS